jgi:hypothetical protein
MEALAATGEMEALPEPAAKADMEEEEATGDPAEASQIPIGSAEVRFMVTTMDRPEPIGRA